MPECSEHNNMLMTAVMHSTGTGLVGLVCAVLGGEVTCADHPRALRLLEKNIKVNASLIREAGLKAALTCAPLEWGVKSHAATLTADGAYDLILIADCVHWPELFSPLIESLVDVMTTGPETRCLIAYEERKPEVEAAFFALLKGKREQGGGGFIIRKLREEEMDPRFYAEEIHVYDVRHCQAVPS